jgi:hypothetical protein
VIYEMTVERFNLEALNIVVLHAGAASTFTGTVCCSGSSAVT